MVLRSAVVHISGGQAVKIPRARASRKRRGECTSHPTPIPRSDRQPP
ncbi:MAG: hypothetical protein OJF60_001768 [Burkholderiaceae bacterium]|nr:MAG: hypothetical protein OJF60_001768 [Burkholderiaceae bacterium]